MTKKKKQIKMSILDKLKSSKIQILGFMLLVSLLIVGIFGFISVKSEQKEKHEYVEKNVINNYVCKIVGADADKDMIAVECLTK